MGFGRVYHCIRYGLDLEMEMSTGYSSTPLIQKLGIRQGYQVCVINQPDNYVETHLNREIVREIGLSGCLVDVKVAAIDATWSGLKFIYRTKDR